MLPSKSLRVCAPTAMAILLIFLWPSSAMAADCNGNQVDDTQDISSGTSQDCDLNGVPDECQPDTDGNGTIDACENCGTQITNDDIDEFWGFRQPSTSRSNVLFYDANDDVHYYDGVSASLIQARTQNNVDLGFIINSVFGLGTGTTANDILAAWRRGTGDAWIWANNGQPPVLATLTNPYDATKKMNPEDSAIADGCIFLIMQALDPTSGNLTKHVFKVDPATGNSTLLTNDLLNVVQSNGGGAQVNTLVTSQCKAAWSWCTAGDGANCTNPLDLYYFNGTTTALIDTDAKALGFARGRLLYSKPVSGVTQLFLYDTNLATPSPTQLTTFTATDKQILYAQTDGRNVVMLVADAQGQNRDLLGLGGLLVNDTSKRPTNNPPSPAFPFQLQRGQLLWTAENTSVVYFDGRSYDTVCSEGWLADGFIAQLRKSKESGPDTEVFLAQRTTPKDAQQPTSPLLVEAAVAGNGQAKISFTTVLGATSYKVYYALQSGVNATNYLTLPGGGVFTTASSPATISGLTGTQPHFFVVSALEGTTEGPVSPEVSVVACTDPTLDTDKDGTPDCSDACPSDPNKTQPGACGCGVPDTDANNNGTPDCLDQQDACPNDPNKTQPGVCGCGVPDTDTTGNGIIDCLESDACPNDPNKTQPGICGCGVPDTDTDGDGTPDCNDACPNDPNKTQPGACGCGVADTDANGNGIPDCQEEVGGETPPPPAGCAPGVCGTSTASVMPLTILGIIAMRRVYRRRS